MIQFGGHGRQAVEADAIVIGAGINGLICAAILAQARLRVLVLEARNKPGGFCATGEIITHYRTPLYAHWVGPLDPILVKSLKSQKTGFEILQPRLGATALSADGSHIVLDAHSRRGTGALAQHSQLDAKTWGPFEAAMRRLASGLSASLTDPPLRASAKGAQALRNRIDEPARAGLMGLALRSIASLAEEYFESPLLKGALALEAIVGTGLGPRTPGGAVAWIERLAVETSRSDVAMWVQGGPGALAIALNQAAQAAGATIRVNSKVEDLFVQAGRVDGVVLAGGERIHAPIVVSSLAPEHLAQWRGLCRAAQPGWRDAFRSESPRHGLAKVHLALRGTPQFKGLDAKDLRGKLLIAESLDAVDIAYQDACAGRTPAQPPMEIVIPTSIEPALAPKDGHILSALIPFAPLSPGEGWGAAKSKLTLATIEMLARFAPDLPNRILSVEVETPDSMARISPVAASLWRKPGPGPLHESNPYAGPVEGLYFCGAGTHPRLGASGLNGRNCAEAVLSLAQSIRGTEPAT